ncbi:MAG: DNA polymerase III subunit alpha [Ectothiorhodospiraceae bacterium]|nr:DNA polymerase III subunit alpha [Ectothiorhodospiraceae bacterium]
MHLHVHSYYSFLAGTLSVERLIEHAKRCKYPALAITDTNNVSGVIEFYKACKEAGIKPIAGAELRMGHCTAVLLARNWDGYAAICEIVTAAVERCPPARILAQESDEPPPHEARAAQDEDPAGRGFPQAEEDYLAMVDILFTLLTPDVVVLTSHTRLLETLSSMMNGIPVYAELTKAEEHRWMELAAFAAEYGIPCAAANDVYFGEPGGRKFHGVLRTIATNTDIDTVPPQEIAPPTAYFCSEHEFRQWFREYPEAIANRNAIVEMCNVEFDCSKSKFARYPENGRPNIEVLRSLAEAGFAERYPQHEPLHRERLEKELRVIRELGFVDYFLIAHDMVGYAKRKNYPYIGRGSGANSIVAYCLQITNVDPIELDLFFERFLNPERKSPPDFDIDFSWRHRDEVIDYILERYGGAGMTAMLCTIARFRPKAALRAAGKALGIPESEIKEHTMTIPMYGSMEDFRAEKSAAARERTLADPAVRRWWEIAGKLLGFPNHYSIHAGGVVMAPDSLYRYTATQISAKGVRVTQQDMFSAEDWRLEKLDVLSTRGLGTFLDTVTEVTRRTGEEPPVVKDYKIAYRDPRAKHIMKTGGTVGCFYVESPAMIQLLKKLRADSFEMLTAASSVIRPGVAQSGMMQAFIERFHDPSKIDVPHPKMLELLRTTFGVMVYQEDVIKVAHFVAGMSLAEADLLRRAMSGKMRSHDAMRQIRNRFMEGCASRGISAAVAGEIWRQIQSFAGYSFCKAHSASYAVLSFQQAWLKARYPAIFLCSVLNNQGGYYRPEVYIQECKRLGVRLLLPSVNKSEYLHYCPEMDSIQLGFLHMKGVSAKSIEALIDARGEGEYRDFLDFLKRSGATCEDIETMIRCGACDCFGEPRPRMVIALGRFYKHLHNKRGEFDLDVPYRDETIEREIDALGDYTPEEIAWAEYDAFHYTVSCHVLDVFKDFMQGTVKSSELVNKIGRRVTVGGWMVSRKITRTRKGERMMFANFDDSDGMIDVVFFPNTYRKYMMNFHTPGPFRITGKVAEEYGVINIVADGLTVWT